MFGGKAIFVKVLAKHANGTVVGVEWASVVKQKQLRERLEKVACHQTPTLSQYSQNPKKNKQKKLPDSLMKYGNRQKRHNQPDDVQFIFRKRINQPTKKHLNKHQPTPYRLLHTTSNSSQIDEFTFKATPINNQKSLLDKLNETKKFN